MEHVISAMQATSAPTMAASPADDVMNTSVLEQPTVVLAVVVDGVGVLVGCTDVLVATRSYPRRLNSAKA